MPGLCAPCAPSRAGQLGILTHWCQPRDPGFPRLARAESAQLASLCRQAQGNKPASGFSITSNKLYWVQLFCGFRPGFPTASRHLELEQLKDGTRWDVISPPEGRGYASFTQTPSLFWVFYAFLLRKPVWCLLLAPTGWSSSLLIACRLRFPVQKGWGPKIRKKAEMGKGQGNTE